MSKEYDKIRQVKEAIKANSRNDISLRSIDTIEKEISEFKKLDIQNLSVAQIQKHLSTLITGHARTPYLLNPEGVFRARKNYDIPEFNSVNEVWYPDWSKIDKRYHKEGRCNDIAQSLFYCATELATSIIECRPSLNDVITLTSFASINPQLRAKVNPIGVGFLQKLDNGYKTIFAEHYKAKEGSVDTYNNNIKIDDFLNEIFHLNVAAGEEWRYRPSIAITNILLDGEFDAIIYPSISAKMTGANYAFKPGFADENFYINNGRMYKVVEITSTHCQMQVIKVLDKVDARGKDHYTDAIITWRNPRATDQELILNVNL